MKITSILIAGNDPKARASAESAVQLAYPHVQMTEVAGLAEAKLREPLPKREILVLLSPSLTEVEMAIQVRDSRGSLRWPVVVFGKHPAEKIASSAPLADGPPQVGALVLSGAVTRHGLERENERLRGDLRTVGRRISHDLRSPLNSVSAVTMALEGSRPASSPAAQVELTQTLQSGLAEIATLVNRVSFILKATADPPPRQTLSMGDPVFAVLEQLQNRIKMQNASVSQPDSWPEVEGVRAWLEMIWWNLVVNSLDHGGPEPHIVLGWMPKPTEIRFWVRDDGPGISMEKRTRLFEPFDLLHELNSPRGLGLPIVHRLVELMDGRCGYEATAGGGSCLFFTLPVG